MCKVHYFCRQIKGFYQIVIFAETYGAPVSQMHSSFIKERVALELARKVLIDGKPDPK